MNKSEIKLIGKYLYTQPEWDNPITVEIIKDHNKFFVIFQDNPFNPVPLEAISNDVVFVKIDNWS